MPSDPADQPRSGRIVEIKLDEGLLRGNSPEIEHERKVSIADILEANRFTFGDAGAISYRLALSIVEKRLVIGVRDELGEPIGDHALPLSPFSRLIKDYFLVCESYFEAIRTMPPARIEALDNERRRLHDEGSALLAERLKDRIQVDFETARRLFTLICALHWKGD
ncbi:MAG TPA: UPF0262 family protein [Hyphomicrobiales bacterium]|nr:UPF0262 family protein [Hyphomicrobiales bacterium]